MKYNNSSLHTDTFFIKQLILSLLVKLFAVLHLIPLGFIIRRRPIPSFDGSQCRIQGWFPKSVYSGIQDLDLVLLKTPILSLNIEGYRTEPWYLGFRFSSLNNPIVSLNIEGYRKEPWKTPLVSRIQVQLPKKTLFYP